MRIRGTWTQVGVVNGVRGGATESRRLERLEGEVRDLLGGLLDVDEASLQLDFDYRPALDIGAAKRMRQYFEARNRLEVARYEYETAQSDVVHELQVDGVSLRDTATLLGMSFQRVQQLLARS